MNTAIKNLINTLKRHSLSSLLNIAGLAIAFTAFLIIMMQIKYEYTFDRYHKNADRIFRIDRVRAEGDVFAAVIPRGFTDAVIASSPHIQEGSLIFAFLRPTYITVDKETGKSGYKEIFTMCYPSLTRIFDFDMHEGDRDCLKDPEKVLIPLSLAKKMFGKESAVGKAIDTDESILAKSGFKTFTVGGVYKDFPENTQLDNSIYTSVDDIQLNDYESQNFMSYVLLDNPDNRETVEKTFNETFDFVKHRNGKETRLHLTPLTDIYYMPNQLSDLFKTGNPNTSRQLLLIALLVILIAGINFVNFSTSLAPVRMKSINTQKVLGSAVSTLRRTLIFEAVGISAIAFVLSCLVVLFINRIHALPFITADLSLFSNLSVVGLAFIIALILGLLAGIYPAWYMTSFSPALVLKGSFGLSASGRRLRTVLIGIQYVISIVLIIVAMNVQMQNKYMRDFDLGFDKDRIAMVDIGAKIWNESAEVYRQRLMEFPSIEEVGFSSQRIGASDIYSQNGLMYKEQEFYPWIIDVSPSFLRAMNIPIVEGRDFQESDARQSSPATFIFNKGLKNVVDIPAGVYVEGGWTNGGYVAGISEDIKLRSLRLSEDLVAFVVGSGVPLPMSYIRMKEGADISATVEHIRKTVADIDPAYPFSISFYDTFYEILYKKEDSLNKMITAFSLLAIILSIAGVLGLVIFETQYRKKEIGVRKVFGATVASILVMFNTIYFRIIAICFIAAAPVAYYFVNRWLESFVYRTPIHWWIFLLAFVVISLITFITINFQNWKAATANPIDSVRNE